MSLYRDEYLTSSGIQKKKEGVNTFHAEDFKKSVRSKISRSLKNMGLGGLASDFGVFERSSIKLQRDSGTATLGVKSIPGGSGGSWIYDEAPGWMESRGGVGGTPLIGVTETSLETMIEEAESSKKTDVKEKVEKTKEAVKSSSKTKWALLAAAAVPAAWYAWR